MTQFTWVIATTTPLQALYLLNDPWVHEQARGFAARLLAHSADDRHRWARATELALSRPPEPAETEDAMRLLAGVRSALKTEGMDEPRSEAAAWEAMARAVFRLNEFVYLD